MSIAIQNELINYIDEIFTQNIQLKWCEFVDHVVGDNEHFLAYLPLLKCIPAMDKPFDLMVQFNTLRGQFANSEQKMSNLLTDAQFIDGHDYCTLDVDNEKFTESLMFISYNCLKLFIMDTQDTKMIRTLIIAEQMYSKYKPYAKTYLKKLSPKTHYMIIEQKKQFGYTIERYVKSMGNPKKIIVCISGTLLNMQKFIENDLNKHSDRWGEVIVPLTKAIFSTANDDTRRIATHLIETFAVPYKARMRTELREKKQKVPTNSTSWGYISRSGFMIVSSDNPTVPFTHDDFVQGIKEYFVNTLAQKHVSIRDFTYTEYLDCIKELEADRIKKSGYFSAIKANAIYFNEILDARKAIKKEEADVKRTAKRDAREANNDSIGTTSVSTPNGYETNGSEAEKEEDKAKNEDKSEKSKSSDKKKDKKKDAEKSKSSDKKKDVEESKTKEKSEKSKSSAKKSDKKHSDEESKKPAKDNSSASVGNIDHSIDSDSDASESIEIKPLEEEEEVSSEVSDNDDESNVSDDDSDQDSDQDDSD